MKEFIQRHILKIMSLLFAFGIWFYVVNSEPIEIEKKYPITFLTPKGRAVNSSLNREVTVKLRGPRSLVMNILRDQESVFIDLKKYKNSKRKKMKIEINDSDIPVPFSVKVLQLKPKKITLTLEKKIKKILTIKPSLVDNLPSDQRLVKYNVEPSKISVTGPASVLSKISSLETLPIDLSNLLNNGKMEVTLSEGDERLEYKLEDPLTFWYEIKPKAANLTIKNIPIRFLTSKKKYKASIGQVSLSVLAPDDKAHDLRKSDVQVIADIPEKARGKVKVKLTANLPQGILLLQIHPEYITVNIK
jgi:YbbR domain-containing protein